MSKKKKNVQSTASAQSGVGTQPQQKVSGVNTQVSNLRSTSSQGENPVIMNEGNDSKLDAQIQNAPATLHTKDTDTKDFGKMSLDELNAAQKGVLSLDEIHALNEAKKKFNADEANGNKNQEEASTSSVAPVQRNREPWEHPDLKEGDIINYIYNDILVKNADSFIKHTLDFAATTAYWIYDTHQANKYMNPQKPGDDTQIETEKKKTTTTRPGEPDIVESTTYTNRNEIAGLYKSSFEATAKKAKEVAKEQTEKLTNLYNTISTGNPELLKAEGFNNEQIEALQKMKKDKPKEFEEKYSEDNAKKMAQGEANMFVVKNTFANNMATAQMAELLHKDPKALEGKSKEDLENMHSDFYEKAGQDFKKAHEALINNPEKIGEELGELIRMSKEASDKHMDITNKHPSEQTKEDKEDKSLENIAKKLKNIHQMGEGTPQGLETTANIYNQTDTKLAEQITTLANNENLNKAADTKVKTRKEKFQERVSKITDNIKDAGGKAGGLANNLGKRVKTGAKSVKEKAQNLTNKVFKSKTTQGPEIN